MQNRIKLIWRPKNIAPVNKLSFNKLAVHRSDMLVTLKNDTANWITVTDVKAGRVKINDQTIMLAPLSVQKINMKSAAERHMKLRLLTTTQLHQQ